MVASKWPCSKTGSQRTEFKFAFSAMWEKVSFELRLSREGQQNYYDELE